MFIRFLVLLLLLGIALGLNLCLGEVCLSPLQIWQSISTPSTGLESSGLATMIWQIRLPRLLIALVVGAGLALSGYMLQSISRNCLADPYLTGVSSGAGLAVALSMVTGIDFSLIPLAAFAGGLTASLLVALMSRTSGNLSITKLLLSGVALSAICGSLITLIMVSSASTANGQGIFFWLAGGIAGKSWGELTPASLYISLGFILALSMSKPMRLLSVGTQAASALGLNVARTQWILLLTAVLTCGAAVSVSGLVGFVGLIAPFVSRKLFGHDQRAQLIACVLFGSTLVLLSDLAARTLGQGQELPLGTLLSFIGGPFFLWLVAQQKGEGL